ncbi:MAG: hypothetical protein FWD50_00185 [Betaproteobacteria bacterium]|nr:hypothetical protein [Betaproteobacteria bacterium]
MAVIASTSRLRAIFLIVAGLAGVPALAQFAENLPPPPDYRGEIRRGPDGQLRAVPAVEAAGEIEAAGAATMVVGPGERIATIGEAARLARDGEIIEIRPGTYRGQPAVWTQDRLLIRGSGERPVMLGDGQHAEGKGIWVVRGGEVQIENIEFRGARVPHLNGAGIRFEKGQLTVRGCYFGDNEMGILTANSPEQTLEVIDSEFGEAPRHPGDLHHLLYVGGIGRFVLRGSRFSGGHLGHLVKSRARESRVLYNMLVDGKDGKASYELEFPNGGLVFVLGNAIGQSAGTDNPAIIAYGAEGPRWQDNALYLAHNTLVNDYFTGDFLRVWNEKFPAGIDIWQINNLLVGDGNFFPPAQGRVEGNHRARRADLIAVGGTPLRLTSQSPLRGSVRPPGSVRGIDLLPTAEFSYPVGSRPLHPGSGLAPGAFQ